MKTILEYIIDKNTRYIKQNRPEYHCSIQELEKWINDYGVTDGLPFQDGRKAWKPDYKKLKYEIGPCKSGDNDTHWIKLCSHPDRNLIQLLLLKPAGQSLFKQDSKKSYKLSNVLYIILINV